MRIAQWQVMRWCLPLEFGGDGPLEEIGRLQFSRFYVKIDEASKMIYREVERLLTKAYLRQAL